MKLKKLFAGLVASAMAVSTMASMTAFEVTAAETVVKTITVDKELNAWGSQWVNVSDDTFTSATDKTAYTLRFNVTSSGAYDSDNNIAFQVYGFPSETTKSVSFPGVAGQTEYAFDMPVPADVSLDQWDQVGFNTQAGHIGCTLKSVQLITGATLSNDDRWVDNGDDSYSYDSVKASMPLYSLGKSVKANQLVKATVTATQTAHFTLCGSSSNGWQQKYYEVKANTPTVIEFNPDADVEDLQFQSFDVTVGNDVTISNLTIGENTYKLSAGLNAQETFVWVSSANKNYHIGRFVFVVKKSDVNGAKKAVFKNGSTKISDTDTYYTAVRTDAITYAVPSDDYVMFVLTANIGDHSLSEYSNLSISFE